MIRNSFALHAYQAGVPLDVIRDMLGHTSISTTERLISAGLVGPKSSKAVENWVRGLMPDKERSPKTSRTGRQLNLLDIDPQE
jgi:integrase